MKMCCEKKAGVGYTAPLATGLANRKIKGRSSAWQKRAKMGNTAAQGNKFDERNKSKALRRQEAWKA